MEHLIRGIRDAVQKKSWYAATALALALPDACAAVEDPGPGRSARRYTRWADRWTTPYFSDESGKVFLSGRDLFRLRCAFLHEGDFATSQEPPKSEDESAAMFEVLNRVTLYAADIDVVPARNMANTGSKRTTGYSIGVAQLCEWICVATESWLAEAREESIFAERIAHVAQSGAIIQIAPDFDMRPV